MSRQAPRAPREHVKVRVQFAAPLTASAASILQQLVAHDGRVRMAGEDRYAEFTVAWPPSGIANVGPTGGVEAYVRDNIMSLVELMTNMNDADRASLRSVVKVIQVDATNDLDGINTMVLNAYRRWTVERKLEGADPYGIATWDEDSDAEVADALLDIGICLSERFHSADVMHRLRNLQNECISKVATMPELAPSVCDLLEDMKDNFEEGDDTDLLKQNENTSRSVPL